MSTNAFLRLFSKRSVKDQDPELGTTSSLKNKFFKSNNKSLLNPKTAEIESKIVNHLAQFAAVPSNDVYAFVSSPFPYLLHFSTPTLAFFLLPDQQVFSQTKSPKH
jgi:hypothetical protein